MMMARNHHRPWNYMSMMIKNMLLTTKRQTPFVIRGMNTTTSRNGGGGFCMAGPKSLNEILKKDKICTLNKADVMDLWISYHENKQGIYGSVLDGKQGLTLIQRATDW